MTHVGIIGTGHIAAPIVRFLAGKGHSLWVTRRNSDVSTRLAALTNVTVVDPQEVVDAAETVFLCLRPHVAAEVLSPLQFRQDQTILSVMAGVEMATLAELCAPAQEIACTIPLGYLEGGGCPLPACGATAPLAALFEPENPVLPVADERALNRHFAICAMVPGLLDMMATGAEWLGQETGDPASAERYTLELVAGFLAALDAGSPGELAAARAALATEGTLSLQMVEGLRDGGAHDALRATLAAIGQRLG